MVRLSVIFAVWTGVAFLPCNAQEQRKADSALSGTEKASAAHNYELGPGDQITISALEMDEISKNPYRLDGTGYISVALLGKIKAGGLTLPQLESEITSRLKEYQLDPRVSVGIQEFKSQPVSIIGAVASPGVHHLEGGQTLVEALSAAGGLRQDAGNIVKISRPLIYGKIPLDNSVLDSTGEFSVAEVKVGSIMDASHPGENITIKGHDIISVPKAKLVYVIGEVPHPGGFPLTERESMSVLQAVSLAGGLDKVALAKAARILRYRGGAAERSEELVDVKKIIEGHSPDVPLRPDDILYVPTNRGKVIATKVIDTMVSAGTGITVWRASQ